MIDITILGTGSMVPTKERNVTGIYAEIKGVGMLFDCGEGTQRQMNFAGIARTKIQYIFISHWHADHISGLMGLMQTVCNSKESVTLYIHGPKDTQKHIDHLLKASIFDNRLTLEIYEHIEEGCILKTSHFSVYASPLEHGVPCIGFRLVESDTRKISMAKLQKKGIAEGPWLANLQAGKDMVYEGVTYPAKEYTSLVTGNVFTYIPDTAFTRNAVDLAKDADLIVSEATFTEEHAEKAAQFNHMTARQAAQVASLAQAKKLLIFHFSQRYKTTTTFLEEAQEIFPNTEIAHDFMKIKLK